ncbi:MAG: hypothetical protein HQL77_04730 [Magnetococcales bacterium]|nr:hypothetical protein [Magnetococcales bacterium]
MLNCLGSQTDASIKRAEMPSRFIGILTPSEFGEMVEYGFIREIPENVDNPFETLSERMTPKISRGHSCDALNALGCFDQPTFIRLGKKWPQLDTVRAGQHSMQPVELQPTH